MSDSRHRGQDPGPVMPEHEPTLTELVEVSVRRIVTSIVLAGGLIALGLYMQDHEAPRYQVTAADGRIVRVDTESGTVIACEGEHCAIVLQRGKNLEDRLPIRGQIQAAPALPSPAEAPAPAKQAAPAPAAR